MGAYYPLVFTLLLVGAAMASISCNTRACSTGGEYSITL